MGELLKIPIPKPLLIPTSETVISEDGIQTSVLKKKILQRIAIGSQT